MHTLSRNRYDSVNRISLTAMAFVFSLTKLLRKPKWVRRYIKWHAGHSIYWTVYIENFINDFLMYKMSNYNSVAHSIKCYQFGKNSLWLSIVHNKQWNRYSLNITRQFTYTKDGETKEGSCSTYLNLTAAKALVDQLPLAFQLAKNLQNNQGVKIYNLFFLNLRNMLYIFTQVRRKLPQKTRQMECSATMPQLAPPHPGISPT